MTEAMRVASGAQLSAQASSNKHPRNYQRAFSLLPKKRKAELAQVVAELTRVQGKRSAQGWLERQLDAVLPPREVDTHRFDMLSEEIASTVPRPDEAVSVTPCREALVEAAPTTVTTLSAEKKRVRDAVEAAEVFSQGQLELVAPTLTPQSTKVFSFLHWFACSHALSQQQSLKAHQISFFLPAETITLATGVPERTVYDALRRIRGFGFVDYRGHVTTLKGYGNRCDGTVFAVKLNAFRTGEAQLTYDDLKVRDYRNLEEDIREGRTVYRLAQSETWAYDLRESICRLLNWIQSKCTVPWDAESSKPRSLTMQSASKDGLEVILDVAKGTAATRGERIGAAANAIAQALGDQHSLAFWWRFCDALASLVEGGGRDYTVSIRACMQREITAKTEGFARCPAALFISRLKEAGVYREIMSA